MAAISDLTASASWPIDQLVYTSRPTWAARNAPKITSRASHARPRRGAGVRARAGPPRPGPLRGARGPAPARPPPPLHPGWPALGAAVGDPELVPVIVSSEAAVGHNRLLVTALGSDGQSLAAPDLEVRLRFYDPAAGGTAPAQEMTASFHVLLDDAQENPVGV